MESAVEFSVAAEVEAVAHNADQLTDIARTGASAGLNGTFHYDYDDAGNVSGRTYPDSTTASAVFRRERTPH